MNVLSQRELFHESNGQVQKFVPARVPRLTPGMKLYLDALLVGSDRGERSIAFDLKRIIGHKLDYRPLRQLIRERCVDVLIGTPTIYTVTRLGRIAREMRK